MECPECGSNQIHRSRRRGVLEESVLPLASIVPFRCIECKARFFRSRMPKRRDAYTFLREPPPWARSLFWSTLTLVVALGVAWLVVRFGRR